MSIFLGIPRKFSGITKSQTSSCPQSMVPEFCSAGYAITICLSLAQVRVNIMSSRVHPLSPPEEAFRQLLI